MVPNGDFVVHSMDETTSRHLGPPVTMAHRAVYEPRKSKTLTTLRASLEHVYGSMGTDTYFGVITGKHPPTDYGIGTATGEIIETGENAKTH